MSVALILVSDVGSDSVLSLGTHGHRAEHHGGGDGGEGEDASVHDEIPSWT
ncbi:MAG: hypothetical protein R3B96_12285 [Pirellulaceae bacterium]